MGQGEDLHQLHTGIGSPHTNKALVLSSDGSQSSLLQLYHNVSQGRCLISIQMDEKGRDLSVYSRLSADQTGDFDKLP